MSKVLKVVGTIAGVVALVAGTISTFGLGSAALVAGAGTVASYAGIAAGFAMLGAQVLYKPPPARGGVTQTIIAPDPPQPYVMGEGLVGGVMRHRAAYGPKLDDVPNPFMAEVHVYSGGGPVNSISPRVDQAAISSWYSGFLHTDTQVGVCPESAALEPHWLGLPGWSADSKLSGQAAILWNMKFDKDGKRFASGVPPLTAYVQGVKVYDPRLDSTQPGGSGPCRIGVESTYVYSENPALHAGTYAFGRYQNGKRTVGVGLPATAIDWPAIAAWANVCQANGWTIFGRVFEPGDRWANLVDIAAAGGGVPVPGAGQLTFHYSAPRVPLDTFTDEDLAEGPMRVTAMSSWRERLNTIVPKYISPDHNWEQVPATAVTVPAHVAEDGEEKKVEWPFNLVKQANQAAQLARYRIEDSRELQPIELTYGPRVRAYRPGDCIILDHPELGLDGPAVILQRTFDPTTLTVSLTLMSETPGKHAFALGQTTTPPPTPAIGQSGEERDEVGAAVGYPDRIATVYIYKRSATVPALPTATVTYDFATHTLADLDGGWSAVPVAGSDPQYIALAVAQGNGATDEIGPTEWTAPVVWVRDGAAGLAATSMTLTVRSVSLMAYANGGVASFAPAQGRAQVWQGGSEVTSAATFSIVASGCTATINTEPNVPVAGQPEGYYRVTAMPGDTATVTVTAEIGGLTLTEVVSLSKSVIGYEIVDTLPTTDLFPGRIVFLEADGRIYRNTDGTYAGWSKSTAAADLTGQITSTQITDGAISTPKLAAGAVDTAKLAASAITSDKISAGAITAAKLASTELITMSAQIGNLVVDTLNVKRGAITDPDSMLDLEGLSITGLAADVWHNVASVTVNLTTSTDRLLFLLGGMIDGTVSGGSGTFEYTLRLVRGGTVIRYIATSYNTTATILWSGRVVMSGILADSPGSSGNHTYSLQVKFARRTGTGTMNCSVEAPVGGNAIMAPIVFKR